MLPDSPQITAQAPSADRELKLEFVGDARDYFRIWVVNLCLTLLTFGVFSAWAKVRKQRYFYSCTVLDGTPFQYLGQPIPIFKGRVIAACLFVVYYATQYVALTVLPYVIAGAVVLGPWVISRSAAFKSRYTAYRNMTFTFHGGYEGAVRTIYWLGVIPMLAIGSVFEWWGNLAIMGVAFGLAGLLFPWWLCRLRSFVVTNTSFGGQRATFSATGRQFFKIYFLSGWIVVAGGVVTGLVFSQLSTGGPPSQAMVLLATVPVYFGYALAFAYVQANTGNLVWNSIQLDSMRFRSTLRAGGLFRLYLTNAFGIIVSIGLLTPWAVVRTMKYRADHLNVSLQGNLEKFRGTQSTTVAAAGAEVGDLFDLELSL